MANENVLSGLIRKRAEITAQVEGLQMQLRQFIRDADNLDGAIRRPWDRLMHCWFCESPLRRGPAGFYCPFAACPAIKDDAGWAVLDGPETERWRRLKAAGTLRRNLLEAGLLDDPFAADG